MDNKTAISIIELIDYLLDPKNLIFKLRRANDIYSSWLRFLVAALSHYSPKYRHRFGTHTHKPIDKVRLSWTNAYSVFHLILTNWFRVLLHRAHQMCLIYIESHFSFWTTPLYFAHNIGVSHRSRITKPNTLYTRERVRQPKYGIWKHAPTVNFIPK